MSDSSDHFSRFFLLVDQDQTREWVILKKCWDHFHPDFHQHQSRHVVKITSEMLDVFVGDIYKSSREFALDIVRIRNSEDLKYCIGFWQQLNNEAQIKAKLNSWLTKSAIIGPRDHSVIDPEWQYDYDLSGFHYPASRTRTDTISLPLIHTFEPVRIEHPPFAITLQRVKDVDDNDSLFDYESWDAYGLEVRIEDG